MRLLRLQLRRLLMMSLLVVMLRLGLRLLMVMMMLLGLLLLDVSLRWHLLLRLVRRLMR